MQQQQQQQFSCMVGDSIQVEENQFSICQPCESGMWDSSRNLMAPAPNSEAGDGIPGDRFQLPAQVSSVNVTPIVSAQVPPLCNHSLPYGGEEYKDRGTNCSCWSPEYDLRNKRTESRQKVSSFEFRRRQRAYITNLETHVNELANINAEFQSQLHRLASENKQMKDDLIELRAIISRSIFCLPSDVQKARSQSEPCRQPIQATKQ